MAIRVPWIYHTYYGGDLGARVEAERVGQRRARQQRLVVVSRAVVLTSLTAYH